MVDLSTSWLGLPLSSPLVLSASPLSRDPDAVARAVDAGASAVVMRSLFEEQLHHEALGVHLYFDARVDMDAESRGFVHPSDVFAVDETPYLAELERLRRRVSIPIVGSLNGTTPGGWTSYAKRIESAGASALELNLYEVATSPDETGAQVEERQIEVVRAVVQSVSIPVNVKISPFYASVPSFARRLERVGAKGLSLFNRFYQPDVSLDELDVDRHLVASTPAELPLRLHALALLSPITRLSLACTGGVHSGLDAAKAILSGAHVVQMASAILERGPEHFRAVRTELAGWLGEKGYASSAEARAVLDLSSAPDPHAYERVNYARMLHGWEPRR